jgi:hypothetical protein
MICYICGNADADTKDHVIPKTFLGRGNFNNAPRLTLPAHRKCNESFSEDEEYTRDVVVPSAEFWRLPGAAEPIDKLRRSIHKGHGKKRRAALLQDFKRVELRTRSGLHLRTGIGVKEDRARVRRVGEKIVRGIIFSDFQAFIPNDAIKIAYMGHHEVTTERERELAKGNLLWEYLTWDICQHDMYAESIAARRAYLWDPDKVGNIQCIFGVALLTVFYIGACSFTRPDNLDRPIAADARFWQRTPE